MRAGEPFIYLGRLDMALLDASSYRAARCSMLQTLHAAASDMLACHAELPEAIFPAASSTAPHTSGTHMMNY